jgi:hypothetical protein
MSGLHLGLKTRFYYCQIFADFLMRSALSDERIAADLVSAVILESESRGTHDQFLSSPM